MRLVFLNFILFVILSLSPTNSVASVKPTASLNDAHYQTIKYNPEQVVQLMVAQGYQLSVSLAPGEQIDNIAIGDSASWQVTPNQRGDFIFIKLLSSGISSTNLTVVTNARTYMFLLTPAYGGENELPFLVKFEYQSSDGDNGINLETNKRVSPAKKYKLSGAKDLKPTIIYDDGLVTFIQFAPNQDIPAIYSIDDDDSENLLDGKIRDGKYVIDGINRRLLFRLGKKTAIATRVIVHGENVP